MKYQPLQIWNLSDLYRFHRYVRSHHIHGTVRQNKFVTGARNTFMLAMALPLSEARLEITGTKAGTIPAFEMRPYGALKSI